MVAPWLARGAVGRARCVLLLLAFSASPASRDVELACTSGFTALSRSCETWSALCKKYTCQREQKFDYLYRTRYPRPHTHIRSSRRHLAARGSGLRPLIMLTSHVEIAGQALGSGRCAPPLNPCTPHHGLLPSSQGTADLYSSPPTVDPTQRVHSSRVDLLALHIDAGRVAVVAEL